MSLTPTMRTIVAGSVLLSLAAAAPSLSATALREVDGTTVASPNVGVGRWHLRVVRLDRRTLRATLRLSVPVKHRTALRFDYATCSGSRQQPGCAHEAANRSSKRFVVRPGSRTLRLRVTVSYPKPGTRTACFSAEAKDLNLGGRQYLLGPHPLRAQMVCPR